MSSSQPGSPSSRPHENPEWRTKMSQRGHAWINGLPSEVLHDIFKRVANLDRPLSDIHNSILASRFDTVPDAYAWLVLTIVCRGWYQVCVACKPLWARILIPSINTQSFLDLCLTRAQPHPLSISYCERRDEWPPTDLSLIPDWIPNLNQPRPSAGRLLTKVLQSADRVQEAYIEFPSILPYNVLLQDGVLAQLGPLLHSLTLGAVVANPIAHTQSPPISFPLVSSTRLASIPGQASS